MVTIAQVLVRRVIKYLNVTVGLILIAVLGLVWWFGWRTRPQTSGTVSCSVTRPVTVTRDAIGVSHIEAATDDDIWFSQGYVTAQDRLWQMDAIRRSAAGELAEIVGASALELDREARLTGLRRIAEEQVRMLRPEDRAIFAAYARGVNYFIETNRNKLPPEFTILGYDPRPWRIADTLLCGLQMFRTLTANWRMELQKAKLREGGDAAKVDALFPVRTGGEVQPGSNAWAISGTRTVTGRPILANDTHLEFTFPSTWYMVHLKAPGLNVTGFTLPGIPAILIGHNEHIGWGVTNLEFDVQDLYIEKMDLNTGRYTFQGQTEQARLVREWIQVKGSNPVDLPIWISRHGPVFVAGGGSTLTLRWAAAGPEVRFPFAALNRARNWEEFRNALSGFPGPAQNFVYADRQGRIAYQAAGRLPVRPAANRGDVPADGATGSSEWDGFIPFDALPTSTDPPSGMVVTANQNPFPPAYRFPVAGKFASHYRSSQIHALLESRKQWDVDAMLQIQTDVYSSVLHYIASRVVAVASTRQTGDPAMDSIISALKSWNGQMSAEGNAPLAASLVLQHLRRGLADLASPGKGLEYDAEIAPAVIERILREQPAGWFDDYDQWLMGALVDAIEEGKRLYGRDPSRWHYGDTQPLVVPHPVLGRLPWIGGYFRLGPVPHSGSPTTVKQMTRRLGPSMRMVLDTADWEKSVANITVGQSGHPLSGHFRDQWSAHLSGRSFPMQFQKVEAVDVLRLIPGGP